MANFSIIADCTCDLNEELQKKYDIIVLPGHITLPNGNNELFYPNWDKVSHDEFYADLKKRPTAYTTSPANVAEFGAAFEKEILAGKDVLCVTISGAISGACGFATSAKNEVLEKYPEAKIEVIDSLRFGPGFGLLVVYAAMQREAGKSMEEVAAYIEENKNRFHQAGWLDDLTFVARKGRLNHAAAFFGTLAGVKPIGEFDYNGLTTVLGKASGAKAAYAALIKYIAETIEDPEEQIIFIAQGNRMPQAIEYKKLIEENFHPKAVLINDVYPSVGVNVGPGLMAAYYVGKPISKDLETEKAILQAALNGGK